jgi:hypothetical protein
LTAYNHNLDTSREHYPKVGLRAHLLTPASLHCPVCRSSLQEPTMTAWTRYRTSETQVSVSVRAASLGWVSPMLIVLVSSGKFPSAVYAFVDVSAYPHTRCL